MNMNQFDYHESTEIAELLEEMLKVQKEMMEVNQ